MSDIAPILDPRSSAAGPAASPLSAPTGEVSTRSLATASSVGTTLEWYDFTVYNTLAALIFNQLFFPSFDPVTGTILAFSTYAVGYVSRPIGGVWFGHLGDQRGRRFVLVATVIVMGVDERAHRRAPTYASAGVLSPILLVTLRFVQGVALGGEWAGAVLISVEHGAPDKRGRNGSFTQVGPACGTLLATGAIALMTYLLSPEDFLAWGWRIPFLASVGLVLFGIWIRSGVGETPLFKELEQSWRQGEGADRRRAATPLAPPADRRRRAHRLRCALFAGLRLLADLRDDDPAAAAVVAVDRDHDRDADQRADDSRLRGAVRSHRPAAGLRRRRRAGHALGVVFFMLLDTRSPVLIVLAVIVGVTIHAAMFGPQAAFVIEQFPTRVRYAGSSLAYTLAGILGAGFAPLIMTTALRAYGTWIAISIYVAVALAVTLLALAAARETANRPLAD